MIERDAGRALTMAAGAIAIGRDPRTLTEELIGYLRNGFLSIMAPDLVQLPSLNVSTLSDQAQRLGAAGLVQGIEQLGEALTEMRNAPDPRVLLDVAIVKLTSDAAALRRRRRSAWSVDGTRREARKADCRRCARRPSCGCAQRCGAGSDCDRGAC